jgi:lysozyme family protein
MMPEPWPQILARLIDREGGGREHPSDRGGATRYGMTLATYRSILRRPNASEQELRALCREAVTHLYYKHWVLHPTLSLHRLFPTIVAEAVLDIAVLFGRRRAALWLQEAINETRSPGQEPIRVDADLGDRTREALTMRDSRRVIARLVAKRVLRHATVIRDNPGQAVFGVGWASRALHWLDVA